MLELAQVQFRWPGRDTFALSIPQFSLRAGERVLLLGPSGAGKSSLLSLICGIVLPHQGRIALDGTELTGLSPAARDRARADGIGIIFQQFNLLPFASVRDNILLPLSFSPARRARVTHPGAEIARLCTALDLPHGLLDRPARALSVGQQQRVAAARALIGAPGLIVADEPTSALDEARQARFLDLLFAQAADSGAAVLMVSHNARLAPLFDRAVQMDALAGGIAA